MNWFGWAFNMRLGTNVTALETLEVAHRRGMSMTDLFTIPENDEWYVRSCLRKNYYFKNTIIFLDVVCTTISFSVF